jgi:hypothetical protein
MAGNSRSTDEPDFVPLLNVLQDVRGRRSVDDTEARDIIREAHCLGDLDLRIRRPNGSFEVLSPRAGVWEDNPWQGETWRQMFDRGIINAEYSVPGSRRRANPSEPCRVYVTRESLDRFFGVDEPSPYSKQPDDPVPSTSETVSAEKKAKRHHRPAREVVEAALQKLYPDGVPSPIDLIDDKLVSAVLNQLKAEEKPPASKTTILRAAGRRLD